MISFMTDFSSDFSSDFSTDFWSEVRSYFHILFHRSHFVMNWIGLNWIELNWAVRVYDERQMTNDEWQMKNDKFMIPGVDKSYQMRWLKISFILFIIISIISVITVPSKNCASSFSVHYEMQWPYRAYAIHALRVCDCDIIHESYMNHYMNHTWRHCAKTSFEHMIPYHTYS